MINNENLLEAYLLEYDKLKEEQVARIGFRDNLLYVTLVLFGGILSLTRGANFYGILVIPCICIVLGWTYLVNDEKITSIGVYIQTELSLEIESLVQDNLSKNKVFKWEDFNRSGKGRKRRKIEQFIVNECAFVLSGIGSLFIYFFLEDNISSFAICISLFEFFLLLLLGVEFFIYADFFDGSSKS